MNEFIPQVQAALTRFIEWKGNEPAVVFPYVTDLHSGLEDIDPLNSQKRETLSHILIMNKAAELFNADFIANLGDFGIDVPVKESPETDMLCRKFFEFHDASSVKPVLYAIGNHDIKKGVTSEFLTSNFQKINSGCRIISPENRAYGFYDIPEKKTRTFFLFCNETPDYYSAEQFDFLEKNLHSMPSGWCALILQHICIRRKGRWQKDQFAPLPENFVKLHEIFASFVKSGGRIAGVFSGDSHFTLFEKADGVNYYSSQGYGGIGPSEAPEHALKVHEFSPALGRGDSFNSSRTCLIDVVAVKPEKREFAVFRIGAGDREFDLLGNF